MRRFTTVSTRAVAVSMAVLLGGCQPKDPPPPVPVTAPAAVFSPDHESSSLNHAPVEALVEQVRARLDDESFVHVVVNETGDGYEVGVFGLTLEAMAELEEGLVAEVPVAVVARPASRLALQDLKDEVAERYRDGTVTALAVSLRTGTLHVGVADASSVEPVHAAVLALIDGVSPELGDIDLTVQPIPDPVTD